VAAAHAQSLGVATKAGVRKVGAGEVLTDNAVAVYRKKQQVARRKAERFLKPKMHFERGLDGHGVIAFIA
jgi:hypothetical protein